MEEVVFPQKTLNNTTFIHLGSKLYFMNKDGGLSVFDVKSKMTKEVLDNTTFVSIHLHLISCISKKIKNVGKYKINLEILLNHIKLQYTRTSLRSYPLRLQVL